MTLPGRTFLSLTISAILCSSADLFTRYGSSVTTTAFRFERPLVSITWFVRWRWRPAAVGEQNTSRRTGRKVRQEDNPMQLNEATAKVLRVSHHGQMAPRSRQRQWQKRFIPMCIMTEQIYKHSKRQNNNNNNNNNNI